MVANLSLGWVDGTIIAFCACLSSVASLLHSPPQFLCSSSIRPEVSPPPPSHYSGGSPTLADMVRGCMEANGKDLA